MKLGRVHLDINYIVDMDNQDMVEHAIESFIEDLMQGIKYGNVTDWIDVAEDKNATEDMIPEFLLEKEND